MKIISLFTSVILVASCLSGCMRNQKYEAFSTEYFDTVTTVVGYVPTKAEHSSVSELVFDKLEYYHKLYNSYESYDGINNIYSINHADGMALEVDAELFELLEFCKEMYFLTDGRTNIAIGSVTEIWNGYRKNGINDPENASVPTAEELEKAALHCDINNLILDKEELTVRLSDPEMRLDVGAVAKGFAIEKTAKLLEEQGINGYLLNAGGSIRTVGTKKGDKWLAAVDDPRDGQSSPYLATVQLENASLVTSGNYQRYYTAYGKNYHHIISPDTLFPAENFISVSVLAADSGISDALSTALFTLSVEEGKALLSKIPDASALWLTVDGEIIMTGDFKVSS